MKVLFATTNLAKVRKYKNALEDKGIELITINDLDFKLPIDENGKNAIENAYIKAKAYYDITKLPTIGIDNSLFIDELSNEKQPGTHLGIIARPVMMPARYFKQITQIAQRIAAKVIKLTGST